VECNQGVDAGKSFQVTSYSVDVGRSDPLKWRPNAGDIVLSDSKVSRPHARLFWQNGIWNVTDLGSANGTYVDGTLVPSNQTRAVRNGSQIRLGDTTALTFRLAGGMDETQISAKRR